MKQRTIAAAGVTAALLTGAGAGLMLNLPAGAGAASDTGSTVTTEQTSDTTASTATDDTTGGDTPTEHGHRGRLTEKLATLVSNGTITQDQADAVTAAIEAARAANTSEADPDAGQDGGTERPTRADAAGAVLAELVTAGTITQEQADAVLEQLAAGRGERGGDGGFRGDRGPGRGLGISIDTAAATIGITADELQTELDAGKTVADVATEHGVDVQTVIDALVADQQTRLVERVTAAVNGTRPERPNRDDASDSSIPADATPDTTATTGD